MAQHRTLFSLLLAQPWWISVLAGGAAFGIGQMVFPPVAPWVALPFLVIGLYVAYRQMRTVSPGQVDERLKALRDMSWEQFSAVITRAYQREGYVVEPAQRAAYDFKLTQGTRVTLLQCRRWKVNQLGVGPLEDLARALAASDAYNAICLAAGGVSPNARQFVAGKPISLVTGIELAALVGKLKAG